MAEERERLTREEEERERLKAYKLEHPEEEEEEEYDADSKPSKKSSIRIFYIIKQHWFYHLAIKGDTINIEIPRENNKVIVFPVSNFLHKWLPELKT